MRSKQAKLCSLILATAVSSALSTVPYTAKAATEKNGIIYVTKKDVKNGKVVISKKTAKAIVIRKSVKKATIQLKGVKLSDGLMLEKGEYVLKTSKSTLKSLKITGKDTKVKLDRASDLNVKNFVLKVAKNTTGSLDLSEYSKKVTAELGKNSDIDIKIGNNDKASIVVKKASSDSKLKLTGAGEGASISKIRVESPAKITVKVDTAMLETTKKADKAAITIESKIKEIKNTANSNIQDKEAERQKAEKEKEAKEKAEREKADKEREEKAKEEKAKEESRGGSTLPAGSGGSSTPSVPSVPEKKVTAIDLIKDGGELDTDDKKIKIKVTYMPADATNKALEWDIKEGADKIKILSASASEAEIQALDNGNYKIEARVKGSTVKKEITGTVSNQKIGLSEGSVGTAADKKVTGLTPAGIYVAEESGSYYSILADGTKSGKYSTLDEASLYSKELTGTEIKELDNAKTYKIYEIAKEGKLEKDITAYLAYTADSITPYNYSDIKDLGTRLLTAIDDKISENSAPDKAEEKAKWEVKKTEVSNKKDSLTTKIDAIEVAVAATKAAITAEYNKIQGPKPAATAAKEAVLTIEARQKEISEKDFNDVMAGKLDRYNEIKAEVDKIRDLFATTLLVGSNGEAKLGQSQNSDFKYEIFHTHTSAGAVVAKTKKAEGMVEANKESFSVLKELRKAGEGGYKIVVYKELEKVENFVVAETLDENPVKVWAIVMDWGSPKYEFDGTAFTHQAGTSDKIRLKNVDGRWILEWDEVNNATSYDIMGALSIGASECNLGSYNLKSTENNYKNLENEFEYEPLSVLNDKVYENRNENDKARSMVAVGQTSTMIELDKFVPVKSAVVAADFWKEWKDANAEVEIWVIPRNSNSLYVSNMGQYIPQIKDTAKIKKLHIVPANGKTFKVEDFYKMFYGKDLKTTP